MKLVTYDDLAFFALKLFPFARRWVADLDRTIRRGRLQAVRKNLERFDPELSPCELDELVIRIYRDRWTASGKTLPRLQGFERVEAGLERGRGVILWESPFGSRGRLHAVLLNRGIEFTQVHGAEHGGSGSWLGQRFIRGINRRAEEEIVPEIVDIQEGAYAYLRLVKARLASNRIVCMPGLGPKGRRFVQLDFLGGQERFATGVASLAISTGAALIPVYTFKERPGSWKTVFEETVDFERLPGGKNARQAAAVERYARLLESYIRRYPEQWRRWYANPISAGNENLSAVSVNRSQDPEPNG